MASKSKKCDCNKRNMSKMGGKLPILSPSKSSCGDGKLLVGAVEEGALAEDDGHLLTACIFEFR